MEVLPIKPFASGYSKLALKPPGSKSLTNRLMLLAALAGGRHVLEDALFSEDTEVMADSLQRLGYPINLFPEERRIEIDGPGGPPPADTANLYIGNAGTAARFLTALCASRKNGKYHLDGSPAMRKRPIGGLTDCLAGWGCDLHPTGDSFPLSIERGGFSGDKTPLLETRASSQLLSALIMLAPVIEQPLRFRVSGPALNKPFVAMTIALMKRFFRGPILKVSDEESGEPLVEILPSPVAQMPDTIPVEPDATAASYFFALPLVTQCSVKVLGLDDNSLQGDMGFLEVLKKCGISVRMETGMTVVASPLSITGRGLSQDFWEFSDTFLTMAAIAPLLSGPTTIEGIAHTRRQETDRISAMSRELTRLGQKVIEREGSITIEPAPLIPSEINTYGDHRIAMSFGILGCFDRNRDGSSWLSIRDPQCCAKTYPGFFEVLESLRTS